VAIVFLLLILILLVVVIVQQRGAIRMRVVPLCRGVRRCERR